MLFPATIQNVAVIAPAGTCDQALLEPSLAFLQAQKLHVKVMPHVFDAHRPEKYFASSAANRTADLVSAWLDPQTDLLFCLRGGFGSAHLLPLLPWEQLAQRPAMPVIGYSDITALHWAMIQKGVGRPIAAPMAAKFAESMADDDTRDAFTMLWQDGVKVLPKVSPYGSVKTVRPGSGQGKVLFGNLAVAASLAGTPYFPDANQKIVIFEDLNEPIYKIDRYLTQLEQAGFFDRIAALVFGQFSECAEHADLTRLFERVAASVNKPCAVNFPIGHTLPFHSLDFTATYQFHFS